MSIPLYGQNKDGDGLEKAGNRGFGESVGTAMADDTAAVALLKSDFGSTFTCVLDGAAKSVTLPASVTADDVGKQIKIYQCVDLVASGVLTILTGASNSMSPNSCFCGKGVTVIRPAAVGNNSLVITGAASNSAFGAGSTILAEVTSAGEYRIEVICNPLGTGNDAVAASTV
tara:strand:+ start:70 stop:585 length:516 start_codon:yes stop_codon:yes gene_type:complete